jgi:hypothetical protein
MTNEQYQAGEVTRKEVLSMYRFGACPECDSYWRRMEHVRGKHWAVCWTHYTKTRIPKKVWDAYWSMTPGADTFTLDMSSGRNWTDHWRAVPYYLPLWVIALKKRRN